MKPPLAQMTKKEILKLFKWKCSHGHSGLAHYNCYRREKDKPEKVGYLDIETSSLKANFGIMISYCIKPQGSRKILKGLITAKDMANGNMDKRIVAQCIDDMRKFDRIVGHYSSRFDIPFIRTRAIIHKLKFPVYGEIVQTDTWRMARNLLALSSNRQDVVAEAILGNTVKTRIKARHWILSLRGDKKSLAEVLDHNIKDVIDLEKNHLKMVDYYHRTNTSI